MDLAFPDFFVAFGLCKVNGQLIEQLVAEACQHPPGSFQRQRLLTKVVKAVGPKLWRESTPYYCDALQQTWIFFTKNICDSYDPNMGSVISWLNAYLKRRLQDFYIDEQKRRLNEISMLRVVDEDVIDITENLPDDRGDMDSTLEEVKAWAEEDVDRTLRSIYINGHPEVTCQALILHRLPPETSWKKLSIKYGVSVPTLCSFYRRQCLPRLRKFGEEAGYL